MEQLKGTGVALVTPFSEDLTVDETALANIVEHCIEGGIDYLVVLGTTAESATLSKMEKQQVVDTVIQANAGKLPLVIGVGGNNTAAVVSDLKTWDLSHFAAILSVSPYYNKPTQEGIYQHFKAISEVSPKPIILYNVPGRTGSNMTSKTTLRLAHDFSNIVAIKEASGDIAQIKAIINESPDHFSVIAGDDFMALPTVIAGGAGVISVLGQGLPKQFSQMMNLALAEDTTRAKAIHNELLPLMHLIFEEGNPAGIKSVLENRQLGSAKVRLPLVEATPALKERIVAYLGAMAQSYV